MRLRTIRTLAIAAITSFAFTPSASEAQLFGGRGILGGPGLLPRLGLMPPVYGPGYGSNYGYSGCGECGSSYASTAYAAPSYSTASYGGCGCSGVSVAQISNPCAVAAAPAQVTTACTYVQPVQETVYKEMPVVKYRSVTKTAKKPVYRTAYEERDVTVYRTVNEQQTVEVPYTTYQQVQSCQTAQVDNSRWQTTYVPNAKMSPCQYDGRPGFLGWMNRTSYEMRSSLTPRYTARRQYVPNVQTVSYPVTQNIPVQASRTVTYNVAKVVPTTEKRQVAVMKLDYEDVTYTAQEAYTEMQTVAVGTTTRLAYVGGPSSAATASSPTPASRTADQPVRSKTATKPSDDRSANASSPFDLNSYTPPREEVVPQGFQVRRDPAAPSEGWAARNTGTPVLKVAGWRSARPEGNALNVAVAATE